MKILFLGDSITDAYHSFDPENLGEGYVRIIHDKLNPDFKSPDSAPKFLISNKGIDGFTVPRVYEMWQSIPDKSSWDIVSVLVGVNDVGVWMDCGRSDSWIKNAAREFAVTYEDMVTDILDHGVKHVFLAEPFIFPYPEKYSLWQPWLTEISTYIQDISQRYKLTFLPLQKRLYDAAISEGFSAVTVDGIHLTEKGNRILADAWYDCASDHTRLLPNGILY